MSQTPPTEYNGDLNDGELIAGRYEILRLLGAGGMGAVYLVNDRILGGDPVAMKVLHRQFVADPKYSQRFLREVQLMRRINHSNVVRTYDVGSDGDQMYFTMEYVPGISLIDWASGHSVARETLLSLLKQICAGLKAIHDAGIVHRDLKPDNIIIISNGSIKIADFGVARPENSELTQHNEIIGSANYMAPEVWLGEPITPSIDLYALGVILYELATGQLPFDAETPAALMRLHLDRIPTPPRNINPGIPIWLNRLVISLLEKRPHQRFKSADEVLDFLNQVESREHRQPKDIKAHSESVSLLSQLEAQSKRSTTTRGTAQAKRETTKDGIKPWKYLLSRLFVVPQSFLFARSARTIADFRPRDTLGSHTAILIAVICGSVLPAFAGLITADVQTEVGTRWSEYLNWLSQIQGFNDIDWYGPLAALLAATATMAAVSTLSRGIEALFSIVSRIIVAVLGLFTIATLHTTWGLYKAGTLSSEVGKIWQIWRSVSVWMTETMMLSPWRSVWPSVWPSSWSSNWSNNAAESLRLAPNNPSVFTSTPGLVMFVVALALIAWAIILPKPTRAGATPPSAARRLLWILCALACSWIQVAWYKNTPPTKGIMVGHLEIFLPFAINWFVLGCLAFSLNRNSGREKKR